MDDRNASDTPDAHGASDTPRTPDPSPGQDREPGKHSGQEGSGSDSPVLRLEGFDSEGQGDRPRIQIEVLDAKGGSVHVARVDREGRFEIPEDARARAHRVELGPVMPKNPTDAEAMAAQPVRHTLRAAEFFRQEAAGLVGIGRPVWERWIPRLRCTTGRVRRCRPSPWWFEALEVGGLPSARQAAFPVRSLDQLLAWPHRCAPVCDARVEVYRRTCCCRPWIVGDPRIPDLLDELEGLIPRPPRLPDPPRPPLPPRPPFPPGPRPFAAPASSQGASGAMGSVGSMGSLAPTRGLELRPSLLQEGALDLRRVHARDDLHALRSLPATALPAYVEARPWLRCARHDCSEPVRVAQGEVGPDGRFNLCWLEFGRTLGRHCTDHFAFVVRQSVGPFSVTLYDGRAANQWYGAGDDPTLTTYHPLARTCRRNPADAFVYLNYIGGTGAWDLHSPLPTSATSVPPTTPEAGLVSPGGATGPAGNRNWGGRLALNLMIGEGMRALGARYYRVQVATAEADGTPVPDSRHPAEAPVSWFRAQPDGSGGVEVVAESLGPVTVGGQNALYRIPFDADGDWDDGQFHAFVDTTDSRWDDPDRRHLVTVEVFDAEGRRLRPAGTPSSGLGGAESEASFTYRRRFQPLGSTAEVPYGALSHLFWWDNREVEGSIEELLLNGEHYDGECLFLTGGPAATVALGYRAWHPRERFQSRHTLRWWRGLGGTPNAFQPDRSENVGVPPAPLGASQARPFSDLLEGRSRCAFSVELRVYNKRTDGSNLAFPSVRSVAAFVLEDG